jgi:hypothetical protein
MPNDKMAFKSIPLDWQIPDDLRAEFATNVIVQKGEHEVFLLFFQAQPPILIGDDREEQLEQIGSIKAKCVAKVIISPERLGDLIRVLSVTFDGYSAEPGQENE